MKRTREAAIWASAPTLFLLFFFLVPLAAMALYTLGPDAGSHIATLWQSEYHRNRILFTGWQALLSTLLTLAIGLPAAYVFAQYDFPGRRFLRAAFTVPFILPTLVVALALRAFMGPDGWLDQTLGLAPLAAAGPVGAILIAHVFYDVSLIIRIVGTYWERFPTPLLDAARTLGTTRRGAFLRIQLPLALPAIASASVLVFLFTFTSFGVILLLAYPERGTIETLIYAEFRDPFTGAGLATTLALLQLLFTYLFLLTYLWIQHASQRELPHRDVGRGHPRPPWTAVAYVAALAVFLLGPLVALARAAFRVRGEYSLEAFRWLADGSYPLGAYSALDAVVNSLRFAAVTLVLAVALGLAVALAGNRSRRGARLWIDAYHMLPLGLSAVVLGLGFSLAYGGRFGIDLRDSYWRIVLAHTLIAFPFAARILAPSVNRIGQRMRGAARTLGAGPWNTLWRVELPLLRPALAVAGVYAFAVSLGEFGATLMLRRPSTATIPLAIFDGFGRVGLPFQAQSMALAFILMVVALVAFMSLERLRPRGGGEFA